MHAGLLDLPRESSARHSVGVYRMSQRHRHLGRHQSLPRLTHGDSRRGASNAPGIGAFPTFVALALSVALPNPASAQPVRDVPNEGSAAAIDAGKVVTGSGATGIGDITVTARRRDEGLQHVPISVTVVSDAGTAVVPSASNASLARAVPNMAFFDGGGIYANSFSIRGVGSISPLSSDDTSAVIYNRRVCDA